MKYPELIHGLIVLFGIVFILLGYIVNYKMRTHLLCLLHATEPADACIQKDVMHVFKVNFCSGIVFLSIGINGFNMGGTPVLSFLIVGSLIPMLINENLS